MHYFGFWFHQYLLRISSTYPDLCCWCCPKPLLHLEVISSFCNHLEKCSPQPCAAVSWGVLHSRALVLSRAVSMLWPLRPTRRSRRRPSEWGYKKSLSGNFMDASKRVTRRWETQMTRYQCTKLTSSNVIRHRVILLEDVDTVGKKGEIKAVPIGYYRNFLLPRSAASVATESVLR